MQAKKEPSSSGMTWAFGVLGGIVIAAADESFAGFLIGVVLGVLCAQMLFLRKRARHLQDQIAALHASHPAAQQPAAATQLQPEHVSSPQPTLASSAAAYSSEILTAAAPPSEYASSSPAPRPAPRRIAKREPDWADRLIAYAFAWLKRGNPLARIGIVILFFGGVFLAKYAADHSMFPIELRFMALAAGAVALLVIGWRLRAKRGVYAEVLQGGGIAGLYLTVFAAASLYQLLPLGLAFGLMVLIALAAAVLAVAQNALSLAFIGTAGGFLAPVLVSTGSGNHIALFSYYAILNVGIFAIAWFRTWRVLNVLGFVFTFTITGLWRFSGYEQADLLSADLFLILFFLMYVGVSILNCVRQPPDLKGYVSGSLVFGLPVVAFTLHATLVARIEYALAWSALATGAFYLSLAWTLLRSGRESFRLLVEAFAALGIIFASLAIPLAFDTRVTAAMWAVEGAGLIWLGVRQQRRLARAFGALLQAAGGVGFLIGLQRMQDEMPVLNAAYLGTAMLAISGLFSGLTLFRNRTQQAHYERGASVAFALWGTAWWIFGGGDEISRSAPEWVLGLFLVYLAATSAALGLLDARLVWPTARYIAVYLPALGALLGLLIALDAQHPFAEAGAIGWLLLFAAFYWNLRRMERDQLLDAIATRSLHAGSAWTLLVVIGAETTYQVDRHAAGVWPMLPWGIVLAVALASLGRRVLRPRWPLSAQAETYRVLVAAAIVIALALWIVLANLTSVGDPIWLPYLPLLNPLDVTVAVCLASGALWWTSLSGAQRMRVWPTDGRILIAIVAGIGFLWLNAALIRSLHHNFGAPTTMYGIARSQFVQAALSIFWALLGFAAMTLAARKRWRYVWIVGGSLMLVVVAKLFLVDLSNVGTIARIVSFLTIGALLLVTGYLAPLPPKRTDDREPTTGQAPAETVNS
ncbi:MAG TPA: DUF2339 domain-containing protein [Steroidobacteraceae bacterium]|nr:DUF2339 domain-containing protein [Steroidobacteraceae bacterium]